MLSNVCGVRHSVPGTPDREKERADVDFDGGLEMLITFAAMHCGENSLYIYGQDAGEVFSLADMIATSQQYVTVEMEEFERISPYFDSDLLDPYVNEGVHRYLSLDYSLHGGMQEEISVM